LVTATIAEPTVIAATMGTPVNVTCNGAANGSTSVTVSGGTTNYTYSWTPSGGTAATASNLSGGTYTCTITDAHTCSTSVTATIAEPTVLAATMGTPVNVTCNGAANGSVTVSVSGGTTNYNYSWTPSGGTAATASNLSGGTYTCSITDANGCTIMSTATIAEPTAITDAPTTVTALCGQSSGSASVNASGGTGTLTYSWSPSGGTGTTASLLAAGTYTCLVTDASTCSLSAIIVVANSNGPTVTAGTSVDVLCFGNNTGSASVNATGGTGTYTYSWLPSGGSTASASGLIAGTYTCQVTDGNGCIGTASTTINQPGAALAATTTQNNVTCNGAGNGNATVTVSGGTTNYTYSWTPSGGTTATASNLSGGTYTCTITDANGCPASTSVLITEPAPVSVLLSLTSTGACNGGVDTLSATGLTSYTWTPASGLNSTSGTQVVATVTSDITYTVTGTDISGCTGSNSITVNLNPDPTTPVITAVGNILTASGSGVLYQWYLNGSPISAASNMTDTAKVTGNYTVMETNGFGCSATSAIYSFTVTGINGTATADILKLYPNPSLGDVTVELNNIGQHTEIDLYDMLGQQIKAISITGTSTLIHHNELAEGIYSYRIIRDNVVIGTGRLVMQR